PYTVTDNNNLILRRNSKNAQALNTMPSGLNFFIVDEDQFVSDFNSEVTSCIAVTDEQASQISAKSTSIEFKNITTGLIFNRKFSLFRASDFRRTLAALVDRKQYASVLSDFSVAKAIVPEEVSMLDLCFREYAGSNICPKYSVEAAQNFFSSVEGTLDKDLFVGARIIVPDSISADVVAYISQEWQRELGFYCVIEQLDSAEYKSRLEKGDFEIAVVDLIGEYNSPAAYLSAFSRNNSRNYGKYSNAEFEELLTSAKTAADMQSGAELYKQAEQYLIDDAAFIPLYYKIEYFFLAKDCEDILYNPFTKTITFKDAKSF
ncbi:MAG: ABC transporter substrate-binding protein, partial [Oscillospiraceae bacterium]